VSPQWIVLAFGSHAVPLEVAGSLERATVRVGETTVTLSVEAMGDGTYAVMFNGRRRLARFASDGSTHYMHIDGETYVFQRRAAEDAQPVPAAGTGHHDVRAPMPGVITQVFVREGQPVRAGDPLYVVEAMKIETVIRAPAEGTVRRVRRTSGDRVDGGDIVVEVEAGDG
jgi:biotin carboxyl carrier protein